MNQRDLSYFIQKYLENAPAFMSLIRPVEAVLFTEHRQLIRKPLLDFGCGDGFFCETVFGKKYADIGLDLSNNPRSRLAKKNNTYKKVVLYDGNKIPLPANSCATVISNCVLEHIPDVGNSVSEINRILKPGGYFITSVMTSRWSDFLWGRKLLRDFYVSYMNRAQSHASLYSEKKWDSVFMKHGFTVEEKTGYLHKKNAQTLDLFHYVSVPSLISYALTGKWVLFPGLYRVLDVKGFIRNVISSASRENGVNVKYAALFYVLKKKN